MWLDHLLSRELDNEAPKSVWFKCTLFGFEGPILQRMFDKPNSWKQYSCFLAEHEEVPAGWWLNYFDIRARCICTLKTTQRKSGISDQVSKGIWWMPWHQESMKDVVSCDKPRVGANNRLSGDFRMGEPSPGHAGLSISEHIGCRGQPRELKHLSTLRKRKQNAIP